ncbi:MAG: cobalamin B12-binding domain-containing protein [Planctomycetota bacterium]|nr:cobalamin B12-binding domain-containing protein [Planctomycetota bacterium]
MSAPRVLVAKPGLDGHDTGAKVVCRALMDAGMEVIYTGLRQSPDSIAKAAVEEDVDVVGLSILSGAHVPLCKNVRAALAGRGMEDVIVIAGGNIPRADRAALEGVGVDGIFPVGTPFAEIVAFIRGKVAR